METQSLRRRGAYGAMAALIAALLVVWAAGVSSAEPSGHAAKRRSMTLSDTASLHMTRKSGNVIYEKGTATGTLPGKVTARFVTGVTKVTGTVTFKPYSGGSVTMSAVGYPQSANTVTRFTGTIAVRKGTGKYKNALGSGTFNGTANRKTWAVTVHATARVTY
jgi:hypothetical protein